MQLLLYPWHPQTPKNRLMSSFMVFPFVLFFITPHQGFTLLFDCGVLTTLQPFPV